jgi:hypothetical protein
MIQENAKMIQENVKMELNAKEKDAHLPTPTKNE